MAGGNKKICAGLRVLHNTGPYSPFLLDYPFRFPFPVLFEARRPSSETLRQEILTQTGPKAQSLMQNNHTSREMTLRWLNVVDISPNLSEMPVRCGISSNTLCLVQERVPFWPDRAFSGRNMEHPSLVSQEPTLSTNTRHYLSLHSYRESLALTC